LRPLKIDLKLIVTKLEVSKVSAHQAPEGASASMNWVPIVQAVQNVLNDWNYLNELNRAKAHGGFFS